MDSLNEEEIWRSQRERINNALAAARNAERQDPAEVYAAAHRLEHIMFTADVEEFVSEIEKLASQTDLSASFNCLSPSGNPLLHLAANAGKDDILRLLLDYVPVHLIAAQNDNGNTPLHLATGAKRSRAAAILIRRTRDLPNMEDKKKILRMKNKRGNTALHEAVLNGHVEGVGHLLNEDLETVYWKNEFQSSPLYLAAVESKDPAIHDVLFSLQLDPSRIQGLPPIQGAIMRARYDLATQILEKNGKLFEMTDSRGGATLIEYPTLLKSDHRPIRRLIYWLILAYIYFWGVQTYLLDDLEDDKKISGTSASQPSDGSGAQMTDDSATTGCGDAPHPPSH
ncbi:hypothetical protein NL676_000601 [Syzygium grande]|nr:hypothetical protein NL676_000601 [Syzygium grande]